MDIHIHIPTYIDVPVSLPSLCFLPLCCWLSIIFSSERSRLLIRYEVGRIIRKFCMEGLAAASKLLKETSEHVSPRRSKSGAPVGYRTSNFNYWGCLQCRNFSNNQFNSECTTCGGPKPPHRFAMIVNNVAYLWYSSCYLFHALFFRIECALLFPDLFLYILIVTILVL